jgi:hypothetical protein
MGARVRRRSMAVGESLPGCMWGTGQCGQRVLLAVVGSSLFRGRSVTRWGVQWTDEDYRTDCSYRWSRQSLRHLKVGSVH